MWEELQRLAARDLRSVNAEIEFLLREGLARRGVKNIGTKGKDEADSDGDAATRIK